MAKLLEGVHVSVGQDGCLGDVEASIDRASWVLPVRYAGDGQRQRPYHLAVSEVTTPEARVP